MRRPVLALAGAALSILAVVVSGTSSVGATTCAVHPAASPAAIASGTERLSNERKFFDHYDFAVIGTVSEIDTVRPGEPDDGAITVTVEVAAVLGDDAAPPTIDVSSPDAGGMWGYPYKMGVAYFIPIQTEGPDGRPNHSFLCDPIARIGTETADELRPLASNAGIPFSTPDQTPTGDSESDESAAEDPTSDPGLSGGDVALAAAAVLVVVLATTMLARNRARRRSAGDAS